MRFWGKITNIPNTLQHYYQRITKGYSYQDVWSLDYSIANLIVNGMKDLKQYNAIPMQVYPKAYFKSEHYQKGGKKLTNKEQEKYRKIAEKNWNKVLDDIIAGYQAWLDDDWRTKPETGKKLEKAQKLLNKYWGGFWW